VYKHNETSLYTTLALTITTAIKENTRYICQIHQCRTLQPIRAKTSKRVTPNGVILANQMKCQGP